MHRWIALLIVSISFSAPAETPEAILALQQSALAGTIAYELVEGLTTTVGPRLAGSAGDRQAVAWALQRFEELGFVNVHAEPVEVPHWDRGEIALSIVAPKRIPLVAVALGGSIGTPQEGLRAEVVQAKNVAAIATAVSWAANAESSLGRTALESQ